MKVTIRTKHTTNKTFDQLHGGALTTAVEEQLPDITITKEFDGYLVDNKGNRYEFDSSDEKGYSRNRFDQLKKKMIPEIALELELNRIY